jgi:hypothetical protein
LYNDNGTRFEPTKDNIDIGNKLVSDHLNKKSRYLAFTYKPHDTAEWSMYGNMVIILHLYLDEKYKGFAPTYSWSNYSEGEIWVDPFFNFIPISYNTPGTPSTFSNNYNYMSGTNAVFNYTLDPQCRDKDDNIVPLWLKENY